MRADGHRKPGHCYEHDIEVPSILWPSYTRRLSECGPGGVGSRVPSHRSVVRPVPRADVRRPVSENKGSPCAQTQSQVSPSGRSAMQPASYCAAGVRDVPYPYRRSAIAALASSTKVCSGCAPSSLRCAGERRQPWPRPPCRQPRACTESSASAPHGSSGHALRSLVYLAAQAGLAQRRLTSRAYSRCRSATG